MAVSPRFTVSTSANFVLGGADVFGTAAVIGLASWGQDSTVIEFSTFTEIKATFKSGQIVDSMERFFLGGGKIVKVVRIVGTDKAKSTINLLNGATPSIQLDGKYYGSYGNNIAVTVLTNGANRDVTITDGIITENYLDLVDNTAIVAAMASSVLVDATKLTDSLIDASSKAFLTLGDDGETVATSDYSTLLQDKLFTKDWDYLTIPAQTTDAFHTTIAGLMDTRQINENKYSLFVTGVDKFEDINTSLARIATSSSARLVVLHTALYDEGDTSLSASWLDASYTAALYMGKLCSLAVNTSPTFKSLPMIGAKALNDEDYNAAQKESLSAAGFTVVTITTTGVYGTWLGVTKNGDNSVWNFLIDNQRKVDYIKSNVYDLTKSYIGKPNDQISRDAIFSIVTSFLRKTQNDRIIEEGFQVEVLKGAGPREVLINVSLTLINEINFISFSLTLNL